MDDETRTVVLKVTLDVVCLFLVAFPILLFFVAGTPYERGFFCDDESLRHPFKDSTVPSWCLYVFGLGIPVASILAIEYLLYKWSNRQTTIKLFKFPVHGWMVDAYRHVGVFGFGAAVSQFSTDIAKYLIGRLRPHFFAVCNPSIDCLDPRNMNIYHTQFFCQNTNQKLIKDMRLSFPSGHSSFSWYCAVFLAMYIHAKITWHGSKLLKHVLQYVVLALAFYTALSRISDYKHHWSDVLCGSLLGITVAVINVVFVSDLFPAAVQPSVIIAEVEDVPAPDKPTQPHQPKNAMV